ncbi:MAG TPA: hypothetical protein DEG69_11165 [Flavobacteriaceae bacterium]|nr:hypothetical protein [Flavobacteriaceae bacterium]
MKKVILFILAIIFAFIITSCKSIYQDVIKGMTEKIAPKESKKPQATAQHGNYSSLPERVGFYPDNSLNSTNFPAWATKELGVTIREKRQINNSGKNSSIYYQQFYNGYPVEGSSYILHVDNGKATYANGLLFNNISVSTEHNISEEHSNQIIHQTYPNIEILDTSNPFILALPGLKQNKFWFCYKTLIFNNKDELPYKIYVDINTKKVLMVEPALLSITNPGQGKTVEGKVVSFNTQYIDGLAKEQNNITIEYLEKGYRLFDTIRNIHTVTTNNLSFFKEMKFEPQEDGTVKYTGYRKTLYENDIIEEDNIWSDNPAAVEAHWGASVTYDYFKNVHNRTGMDGKNGYLKLGVNFSSNYIGAHYNQYRKHLLFGDGKNNNDPVTSLDVVAHEFTHGITYIFADINYNGEPGSITEGISDVFGVAVSFYEGNGDWSIGERVKDANFRNISDPKSKNKPDTYEGDYWMDYPTEFALDLDLNIGKGRHTNSTVLSYWFYLLSEGGKGENDNEDLYEIEKIGIKKATDIVYKSYQDLIPTITFKQYREITIATAKQLYGTCSDEVREVTNAWYAVGVGNPFCECFEGSIVVHVKNNRGESNSMRVYLKEDKTAAEMISEGKSFIQYTSLYDRYWHLKGYPDLDQSGSLAGVIMKNIVQRKSVHLIKQPSLFKDRKEYIVYRNKHKTGNTKELEGYQLQEYILEGIRFWATEDVCLSITNMMSTLGSFSGSIHKNMRQVFFGFPVEIYYQSSTIWVDNIKEHSVDDSYFSG